MRTIYDVSLPITEALPVWPGDASVRVTQVSHLKRGDAATVSRLDLSAHTGTHVDAPAHFVPGGTGADTLDLNLLVGPALVVETDAAQITPAVLRALDIPAHTQRVLFRTRNSTLWESARDFREDFVALTEEGAQWLVTRGARLVGIDYLSIAPFEASIPTHRVLLEAGVIILEGLDLRGIHPGLYDLVCLPLKLAGGDGAPARAILIEREGEHNE